MDKIKVMDNDYDFEPRVEKDILTPLWSKFFPYWPVFILLFVIAFAFAWVYLQYKLPVFESTATLLMKDEKKGTENSKMEETLNVLSSKKIIENETEVIKSRSIVKQVVLALKLYAPIKEKGKWKDLSAYSTSPVSIEVEKPDGLIEVPKIEFTYNQKLQTVNFNNTTGSLGNWINTPWGNLKFVATNQFGYKGGLLYFSLFLPKRITEKLIHNIEVSPSGKLSSVVDLSLKDEIPQRADDILNTLIMVYEKASISDKNLLAQNTLAFLDERLKFVSVGLDSIEKKLQQYKARKGAIDISSQGKIFLDNVSSNDQQMSTVNMKQAVLKQVEQYIQSKENQQGLVPSTLGVDDPLLTSLLNKLYEAELQFEKVKATTGENNPQLTTLANQIAKIKPGILENLHSQQRSLEASKTNLGINNNRYTNLLQALPQQERDLVIISREQNIKSSIYSFLLQKREETALSNSATVSDTRIVDKAETGILPVSWGGKYIYSIAFILALFIGIIIISAKEFFNSTILFRKEIESMISYPVVGEIALGDSKLSNVIEDGKASFIAEEFRMLRTSLYNLGAKNRGTKLLITSTISGEGKSFVAINLAVSLALSGRKVILVEFDLTKPSMVNKLGMEATKGVADYLKGEVKAEEVIRQTPYNNNLFLISAGTLPHNPSELILQNRTEELLTYLQTKYDYVLVDSAPVGLLSDGYVLSRYCDATLYIVRHGVTPKKRLEQLENNKINTLKNMVMVFNGVRSRGFGKRKYGYGYGYGYVYNQDQKKIGKLA